MLKKKNHQEELGRGGQRKSQKKQQSLSQGRKVPLKKNTTTTKKNFAIFFKKPRKIPQKVEYVEKESIMQCLKEQRRESSNISEITRPEIVTSGIFVKQVVFLTVNHHILLPLRELHSTGETIV